MRIRNLKHQYQGHDTHCLYIWDGYEREMRYDQNKVCMHCGSYLEMKKPEGWASQEHQLLYGPTYKYYKAKYGKETLDVPFCSARCYDEYPMKEELYRTVDEFVKMHGKEKYEKQQKLEEKQRNRQRAEYERAEKARERAAAAEREENLKNEAIRKKVRYILYLLLVCYMIYAYINR